MCGGTILQDIVSRLSSISVYQESLGLDLHFVVECFSLPCELDRFQETLSIEMVVIHEVCFRSLRQICIDVGSYYGYWAAVVYTNFPSRSNL